MIIGICGSSGSGKSTLAKRITEMYPNSIHIDIDKIGHQVLSLEEVQKELVATFGENIINEQIIDRKKLGDIVFNSRHEMDKLSDITWKYMQIKIDKIINENTDKIIILDWILLPITKYFSMCNKKILLDVAFDVRKERTMKRDNISEEAFLLREKASLDTISYSFDFRGNVMTNDMIRKLVR